MDIYESIERRRSVRDYREKPVSDETLEKILNAVRLAPSAHNAQEYKFVVAKDPKIRKELMKACAELNFVEEAPIVIAAVSLNPEYTMESGIPAYPLDLAVALDHLTLVAASEELGTCWVCSFSQEEVQRILNIPVQYKVVALMTLGYPADEPGVKSRKKLKDLVSYDTFSEQPKVEQ